MASRTHFITNGKDIIDIDIRAIKSAMSIYKVENEKVCFEKVRKLFHHFLTEPDDPMMGVTKHG